jgi:hypothetical protein
LSQSSGLAQSHIYAAGSVSWATYDPISKIDEWFESGKWTGAFLVLGLLVTMHSFAGSKDVPEGITDKNIRTHFEVALHYEEQAQANKSKADNWEFMVDYFEKFPKEYNGTTMPVKEHIAQLRAIAADFKKAEEHDRALASKHRALSRHGLGPVAPFTP